MKNTVSNQHLKHKKIYISLLSWTAYHTLLLIIQNFLPTECTCCRWNGRVAGPVW